MVQHLHLHPSLPPLTLHQTITHPRVPPLFAHRAHAQVPVYFEGRMLANYLVSSGRFEHPTSRRPLARSECLLLDAYCKQYRLGCAYVTEVLDEKVSNASQPRMAFWRL